MAAMLGAAIGTTRQESNFNVNGRPIARYIKHRDSITGGPVRFKQLPKHRLDFWLCRHENVPRRPRAYALRSFGANANRLDRGVSRFAEWPRHRLSKPFLVDSARAQRIF